MVISVTDANTAVPAFASLTNPVTVAENTAVGNAITTVRATDADSASLQT